MQAREIYGRYRHRLTELAHGAAANRAWEAELSSMLRDLKRELSALDAASAAQVRSDLCEQLELAMHGAADEQSRHALIAALKHVESDV